MPDGILLNSSTGAIVLNSSTGAVVTTSNSSNCSCCTVAPFGQACNLCGTNSSSSTLLPSTFTLTIIGSSISCPSLNCSFSFDGTYTVTGSGCLWTNSGFPSPPGYPSICTGRFGYSTMFMGMLVQGYGSPQSGLPSPCASSISVGKAYRFYWIIHNNSAATGGTDESRAFSACVTVGNQCHGSVTAALSPDVTTGSLSNCPHSNDGSITGGTMVVTW